MKVAAITMQRFAALALVLFFAGFGVAQTQGQGTRVILKGYDPVAYFTQHRAVKGAAAISYDFDEGRYLFSNSQNRQAFSKNPDQYAPQFAGFCTAGLAKGMKAEADPEIFMIVNGKLYTFSSLKAKNAAEADPTLIARADKNWREKK